VLIIEYEALTQASLIVVIDQIFPPNLTYLEELLFDLDPSKPLHVLLASPGGDGETAIRMVRSMQARCSELTMVLPDMAKSAATVMCLGADRIVMGPGGDLGPVDPQFQLEQSLASAKELVAAVDEAEDRITANPDTYPLFAGLLSDVNMLMVEQARSALARTGALVREALACVPQRTPEEVESLAGNLQAPLIDDPSSHSAVIPVNAARQFGLPAEAADPSSESWSLIWSLWTRYFAMGCFPAGPVAIYEGRRASHALYPD
jgi:Serine dehydrogenase proteinase